MKYSQITVLALLFQVVTWGKEISCSLEMDRLMVPRKSADMFGISTVKVSYSFTFPKNMCSEMDRLVQSSTKQIELDGCLNGLGYIGTIQFRRDESDSIKVYEIELGCDQFKMATFEKDEKWYELAIPDSIRRVLIKREKDAEVFHEKSIDGTYYYKKDAVR